MDGIGGGAMTPEQVRAYLDYVTSQGAFSEQDRAVQQQLAIAQALRERQPTQHSTGAGAALGGAGDMLNALIGARGVSQARGQDTALQQARIASLRKLAATYGQQQQPQMMPGLAPTSPGDPGP